MLLLFLTWKHDGCFNPHLGQHLQSSRTPDIKPEDEDEGPNFKLLCCELRIAKICKIILALFK